VHLFERDCSVQRRHQKVIEEAPAPGMDEATRAAVCEAAVRAARAVDYVGAGTVEFIADVSEGLRAERIWFMEMNTRLQVEHPVTETITGEDLVEWQLRVASGEPLPKRQEELAIHGHAIEARLYAEDPAHEFLPSTGRLDHCELPRRLRVDTGVGQGDRISAYYDPMIAKLVAAGSTRAEAIGEMIEALDDIEIWPVKTNAGFLRAVVADADFQKGEVDTGFIPGRIDRLVPDPAPHEPVWQLAALAMLGLDYGGESEEEQPWLTLQGFRANAASSATVALRHAHETRLITVADDAETEGIATTSGETLLVFSKGQTFAFTLPGRGGRAAATGAADGAIVSPMPGRVVALDAREGASVAKGERLVTIEAMKMEHSLVAPFDGIVAELHAVEGAQVTEGSLLARVSPSGESDD
jgi:3-methylcrotonyl-CoA carboxylase alpha subunit